MENFKIVELIIVLNLIVLRSFSSFELRDIELTTKLKPFMPEYMASVTDVDAFVKVRVCMKTLQ